MAVGTPYAAPVINPDVSTPQDDVEDLVNGFLSSEKLMTLTGAHDLANVHLLEMKVDVRKTSLGSLGIAYVEATGELVNYGGPNSVYVCQGKLLPELEHLKLSNSYVPAIRDIGSGFRNLTVLWMARCELSDLDGIDSMSCLEELYLAYNEISDLSSLSMLESLQILDLEGNAIEDFEQIEYLGLCGALRQLTVAGNPLTSNTGVEREADVRQQICAALPQLELLDDVPVGQTKSPAKKNQNDPLMKPSSATTASQLPLNLRRPGTAAGRPQSASRPGLERKEDASSDLTHGSGQIMAGNPILFLRSRRVSRIRGDASTSPLPTSTRHEGPLATEIAPQSLAAPSVPFLAATASESRSAPPESSLSRAPTMSTAPPRFHPRPPSAPRPATADPQHSPTPPASRPPSSYAAARARRLRSVSSPSDDQIM
ncbi:Leucine-rich repeat-containing protein 56 [Geranomyces variabilis]|nr:Leucine-rich repeat-containing protein 56 [Geranomyces variabilis]